MKVLHLRLRRDFAGQQEPVTTVQIRPEDLKSLLNRLLMAVKKDKPGIPDVVRRPRRQSAGFGGYPLFLLLQKKAARIASGLLLS